MRLVLLILNDANDGIFLNILGTRSFEFLFLLEIWWR